MQISRAHLQSRRETEDEPGEHGDAQREAQNNSVYADLLKRAAGNVGQGLQQRYAPIGKENSRNRRQKREQHTFREQLPDDSRTDRTERAAQGDLTLPAGSAREQQIGYVHASNQQDESNSAEQHEKSGTHVPRKLL